MLAQKQPNQYDVSKFIVKPMLSLVTAVVTLSGIEFNELEIGQ